MRKEFRTTGSSILRTGWSRCSLFARGPSGPALPWRDPSKRIEGTNAPNENERMRAYFGSHGQHRASLEIVHFDMRARAIAATGCVTWAGLFLAAHEARAYECTRVQEGSGPSLIWSERAIPWTVNAALTDDITDREAALREIKGSFAAWENVECSDIVFPLTSEQAGATAGFVEAGPNTNVVIFVESGWISDPGIVGVTTNSYNVRTGVIADSDIEMNGERFRFVVADASCLVRSGAMDLRNALTHEVGHLLGLDHPPNTEANAESTMFAAAPPCETKKQTLAEDDINAVCTIYPIGMPNNQCFPPPPSAMMKVADGGSGGCRDVDFGARDRASTGAFGGAWAVIAGVVLLMRRAPRNRRVPLQ